MSKNSEHYKSGYLNKERWFSYVYQIDLLSKIAPESALEIGVGPGAVRSMLEASYPDCNYFSVDFDADLLPTVCADVTRLPLANNAVDVAFCCQVLEHLPFDQFTPSLMELKRVSRRSVIISLPDVSPNFFLRFTHSRRVLPFLWNGISMPSFFPKAHSFEEHGQHFWEIGKRGYSIRSILSEIQKIGFSDIRHFRMTERSYWHFFVLSLD